MAVYAVIMHVTFQTFDAYDVATLKNHSCFFLLPLLPPVLF